MYDRFFRIVGAKFIDELEEIYVEKEIRTKQLIALADELGAVATEYPSGKFAGFSFQNMPDQHLFTKPKGGVCMPRGNTNAGKALLKRLKDLPSSRSLLDAFNSVGLDRGEATLIIGGRVRSCGLHWFKAACTAYVSVPWYDEDPKVVEQYKKDKAKKVCSYMNLDHMLWTPPTDWTEIKEWEMLKEIDEHKLENQNDR